MPNWDREMQKALEADGEKLRQLMGEDHGPYFIPDEPPLTLVVCPECDGAGEWDEGPINCGGPAPVDPEYRQVICPVCGGKGQTVEPVQPDDEADDEPF